MTATVSRLVLLTMILAIVGCKPQAELSRAERRARIASMFADYRRDFPDVGSISAEALAQRLAAGEAIVLVDVRDPEEREVSVLPGAISAEQFEADRDAYRGRPIVTYCTIGYRSGIYAQQLHDRFQIDAVNLEGSILAWVHAGQPLVDANGQPTRRLHVYGPPWDLAPPEYESIR